MVDLVDITNSLAPLAVALRPFSNGDDLLKKTKQLQPHLMKIEMFTNDPRYVYLKMRTHSGAQFERTFRDDGVMLGDDIDLITRVANAGLLLIK